MKRVWIYSLVSSLTLPALMLWARGAEAAVGGAADVAPAATLLFPFVEVDTVGGSVATTVINVHNASASSRHANVVVWTDLGVPVYNFNLVVPAHATQQVDVRDVLNGTLPTNACSQPAINAAEVSKALRGEQSSVLGDKCGGLARGNTIARGFITVDVTAACTGVANPTSAGYFLNAGLGTAKNNNVFIGSYSLKGAKNVSAYAAHLEAAADLTSTPTNDDGGKMSFYRRFAPTGADNRETLPTAWSTPFEIGRTELLVWRETPLTPAFTCGSLPGYYPLQATDLGVGDVLTRLTVSGATGTNTPVGGAVNRWVLGQNGPDLTGYLSGVAYLNLGNVAFGEDGQDEGGEQSWVVAVDAQAAVEGAPSYARPAAFGDVATDPHHSYGGGVYDNSGTDYVSPIIKLGSYDLGSGSTVLLPHFEASLTDPNGPNTLFTVENVTATAILTRATIWTDLGIPVFTTWIYLTGYSQDSYDMRWLLQHGATLPTASAGQDPGDGFSPHGPFSQDINFASCSSFLPAKALTEKQRKDLADALAGKPSATFGGKCAATATTDDVVRGYITIDIVNQCGGPKVGETSYFENNGVMTTQRSLRGWFTFLQRKAGKGQTGPMARIQGAELDPLVTTAQNYTFYGAQTDPAPWNAEDRRESLPSDWLVPVDTGSSVIVWRDPGVARQPFACTAQSSLPAPSTAEAFAASGAQSGLSNAGFPLATQKVEAASLGVQAGPGMLHLNLSTSLNSSSNPSNTTKRGQGFVLSVMSDGMVWEGIEVAP